MNVQKKEYLLKIELVTPMLGTVPKKKDILTDFVYNEAIKKGLVDKETVEAEAETIEELNEKGYTGFHADEKGALSTTI